MRRTTMPSGILLVCLLCTSAVSQAGLPDLPGYERYKKVDQLVRDLKSEGRVANVHWSDDNKSLSFSRRGEPLVLDLINLTIATGKKRESNNGAKQQTKSKSKREKTSGKQNRAKRDQPGRAQQARWVTAPNEKWIARYRDYNVIIEPVSPNAQQDSTHSRTADTQESQPPQGDRKSATIAVTTGGIETFRYGTCCWVYGEELSQSSAMWWSPDSRKLAFYEVDERHMRDYFLTLDNTELYTRVLTERYPKAGCDNPFVGILVYDLETKQTTRINVGGDRRQYVFNVRFTPDGKELLFNRTNRHQNVLEVVAADPNTGRTRVVVSERQATWQNNRPLMQFLRDGQRFIWETERTGWKQFELRHLDGRLLNKLSPTAAYPVESIVRVDEDANWLYYVAYSGTNPNNAHLHRVRLDGSEHARLTKRPLCHSQFHVSPTNCWFVATYEAAAVAPQTALFDMKGNELAILARTSIDDARQEGLSFGELFSFKADDGATNIYGILHKPTHFDPNRKYPLVISVYGGPGSRGIRNRFAPANAYCEFGFLIATIANRGTTGRGKAFESATYLKLGGPDLKDQADGVRFLCQRPYVDAERIGIYGHSYGGYMSALALLKYPDLFHVGVAGAPVTDWKNYDTIYTERYMRTPQENPTGYRAGSCLTFAERLKGKLLLMHGLIDDNVHPANTWQLIDLFQKKDLRFDMLVFPRSKHGLGSLANAVRWEYLCNRLQPEAQ